MANEYRDIFESVRVYFQQNSCKPEDLKKRKDIQEILKMPEDEFEKWYNQSKNSAQTLLDRFLTAGRIPSLLNPTVEMTVAQESVPAGIVGTLERAIQYVDVIKYLRRKDG
jgi:hypothetical protein